MLIVGRIKEREHETVTLGGDTVIYKLQPFIGQMESPPVQNKYVVRMLLIVANGVERNEREKSVHRGNFTGWLLTL